MVSSLLLLVLAAFVVSACILRHGRSSVNRIRGPPPPSWLFGNMRELILRVPHGLYEFQWLQNFGPVYRVRGCLGERRLMISDPMALRMIVNNNVTFEWSQQQRYKPYLLIGKQNFFAVNHEEHQTLRRIVNPVFSMSYVHGLIPMFQEQALKLVDCWKTGEGGSVINVYPSIQAATLDSIGRGTLRHDFGALESAGKTSPYVRNYRMSMKIGAIMTPSTLIFERLLPYLPERLLDLSLLIPNKATSAVKHHRDATRRLFEGLTSDTITSAETDNRTLLDVFVQAEASLEEMSQRITTILIAGQVTIANTLSWMLYELARDLEWQIRLREEVLSVCGAQGKPLSQAMLDRLTFLNAHLKETLRFYPGLPIAERVCTQDTIIPLSQPISATDGEKLYEIPVQKGQFLMLGVASYHRIKTLWGEDADRFRPQRWLDGMPIERNGFGGQGPYGSLMTFLGGPHTCLGWRFAISELQVLFVELVRSFEFGVSEEVQPLAALTIIPVSKEGRAQLPLVIKTLDYLD